MYRPVQYADACEGGPLHIARVWDRYNANPKYLGGAVVFCARDYERINGFPNSFWGWGGEDDALAWLLGVAVTRL